MPGHRLLCTCRACYLLFTEGGASHGHYRAVPDRYQSNPDFTLSAAQWDAMGFPVNLAFLFYQSDQSRYVAFYPSPGGATESLLDLAGWDEVVAGDPRLQKLVPDVEAVLSAPAGRRVRVLPGPDRRLLRAGRDRAPVLGGLRRRRGRLAADRRLLRADPGAQPWLTWTSPAPARRPTATRPTPAIRLQLRIAETTGTPVHAMALRCQIRIEPIRRALQRRGGRGAADLFGEPRPLGRDAESRCYWSPRLPDGPQLHRRASRSTCRSPAPTTSRSPRTSTCTPSTRRASAAAAVQRDDVHRPAGPASVSRSPWQKEATYRLPVGGVAGG